VTHSQPVFSLFSPCSLLAGGNDFKVTESMFRNMQIRKSM